MKNKRILITGGNGFLGKHLILSLRKKGYTKIETFGKNQFDLTSSQDVSSVYSCYEPEIVIHLAAKVGGIGYNQNNPASLYYDNAIMGIQMMHHAYLNNIEKFVAIGTVCSYPKYTYPPFKEKDLWNGYPEETNAPYGLAKKMMLIQSQAYRKEYNFNSVYLIPVNLYGPGDNFNPDSSHVIPALIKKCVDAKMKKEKNITIWGTGTASREFLYVEDAVEAIILATEKYNSSEPVNLGTGKEIQIKDLIKMIADLVGFKGNIITDSSKPDGQPRRCLDTSKALKEFNFQAKTSFNIGLKKTINWYLKNKENINGKRNK